MKKKTMTRAMAMGQMSRGGLMLSASANIMNIATRKRRSSSMMTI